MHNSTQPTSFNVENPARDVRLSAMNFLARREHSFHELLTKLNKKFLTSEYHSIALIEEQLQRLRRENLQSDERFTEAFINSKKNSGKGPLLIRQQLQQKGLSEALIEQGLETIADEWILIAESVYQKKFSTRKIADQKEKAKRIRFMQSRGFLSHHYMGLLALVAC
jgi:regulatory protein